MAKKSKNKSNKPKVSTIKKETAIKPIVVKEVEKITQEQLQKITPVVKEKGTSDKPCFILMFRNLKNSTKKIMWTQAEESKAKKAELHGHVLTTTIPTPKIEVEGVLEYFII